MKAKVIHSYIDNKIRRSLAEKKSAAEVVGILHERVIKTTNIDERSEKIEIYKAYLVEFSKKRIEDIKFISSKKELDYIPNHKLLNLIQLKDKLHRVDLDFDL